MRAEPINYDYEAKGAQDFAAGRKDERLYGNPENHGASYRRGWQKARREADAGETSRAIVAQANGGEAVAPLPPRQPKPEDWNGSPGSVSIVQPVEHSPVTKEQVRLQTGEDKPKKPKPADSDQLAFF